MNYPAAFKSIFCEFVYTIYEGQRNKKYMLPNLSDYHYSITFPSNQNNCRKRKQVRLVYTGHWDM